ncbi:LysM peptidoglycan-binding domain-containing protein [Cohnella abietis]|uniref:LysM domain-containing protein n=1 Tax=Cohnella abietis TaxID=2507935 RepID=A0A3T1D399_9BACL|nr:LysM peptidoglycan-binding domain-containing protein [Cohnella abietis]BBI32521.1 hypothetical protein KCTCHS21_19200 [Cohnella abietis]
MTDQLNGLRFDIYERVHLPDDVAAIEELEEIELVPHMQALPQDDQVLLRGHLLLSGIYRSQDSPGVSQLEHWIPVEISLPLNRIQSVEELAVEIDNFDVDLLTTRSLNVTGVLALRGLQVQSPQAPIWRDDSFTVVHQAESLHEESELPREQLGLAEAQSLSINEYVPAGDVELTEEERDDDWYLESETEALIGDSPQENTWLTMFQNSEEFRKGLEANPNSEFNANPNPNLAANNDPFKASQWGDVTQVRVEEQRERVEGLQEHAVVQQEHVGEHQEYIDVHQELVVNQVAEYEDRPELKVALGGKPLDSNVQVQQLQQQSGVGLLSQLGEKGAKREAELKIYEAAQAEEKALAATHPTSSSGDELEWTRLFLTSSAQAQSFRKVKMCIVQREETLDLIANRYNVQPRELQLHNRLNDPYLSEGQVLYIP